MTFETNVGVAALAILALGLASCEKPAGAGLAADEGPGKPVTEAEFKAAAKTWPLKVSEARVGCDAPGALFVLSDGKKYGLNDWAAGVDGYADLREIRLEAKKGQPGASAKAPDPQPKRRRRGGKAGPKATYVPADDLVASARTACRW
jgi:hypothetical protein